MKLTIETTKEVEVELPMYIKSPFEASYHAIISKDTAICVMAEGIQKCSVSSALHGDYEVITQDEFCDKYEQVINELTNDFNSFVDMLDEKNKQESYTELYGNDNYSSNEEEGMNNE